MSHNYDKLHSRSIVATAPVPARRFVNRAGGVGGEDIVGVSESQCKPGQTVTAITGYSAIVETAAAIAQGDLVESDADGRAVVASGLGVGVAESTAPAGGRIEVRLHGLLGKALRRVVSVAPNPDGGITKFLTVTVAELAGTGELGAIYTLADGPDAGAKLTWAVPDGASTPTWCWWLWPQSAYEF
ncbi:hypothetical protein GO613_12670 [Azoarcus communis]|uniref:DUF2190 family protein n=1 Tax=Parazoarcus communis TaxID=41977 RepID=UPI0014593215|nr:DUF2190 family protein [Parazoarcus communis]NMG48954.1 hypothetical protein [Parazoarcus communis]